MAAIRCTQTRNSLRRRGFRLHGLRTFGIACKAIVDTFLDGDVSGVRSYGARFAGGVFPGETVKASFWKEDGRFIAVPPGRDNATALSGVELTIA